MQIIIPMAGQGVRFQRSGYTEPKFLIRVEGQTVIEHVIDLFPEESDFIFICNVDHLKQSDIRATLKRKRPASKIVGIPPHKSGPVVTVMAASSYIKDKDSCIVSYCDFNLYWNYQHFKETIHNSLAEGAIVSYKGFHPHLLGSNLYASVRTDLQGRVVEIREKHSFTANKMDSWQSAGIYYFKSGEILKKYFFQLIERNITCNGEYYVSLVYNLMADDHLKSIVYPIEYFCQWGTPEDLEEYLYWSNHFLRICE